jgi:ribosomal protein S12 methylthiotransferase accessory factor YcaO
MTDAGPRSRTLAGFSCLTAEVIERAQLRSIGGFDPVALRQAAQRAGAPVAASDFDTAAAMLFRALADGARPRPAVRRALVEALGSAGVRPAGHGEAAAAWMDATPARRGETLVDLLRLTDSLPAPPRARPAVARSESFPRINSAPA